MPPKRINQENENEVHFLTITTIEWIDIFTSCKQICHSDRSAVRNEQTERRNRSKIGIMLIYAKRYKERSLGFVLSLSLQDYARDDNLKEKLSKSNLAKRKLSRINNQREVF